MAGGLRIDRGGQMLHPWRMMMEREPQDKLTWTVRLGTAWKCFTRIMGEAAFCRQAQQWLATPSPVAPAPSPTPAPARPPERVHASGLHMLALLQREGRLVDFLQEEVAGFSDAEVGAAARAVHAGCRQALTQCLTLEPVLPEAEGATVTVPAGFDAQRIRLTGQVAGSPPFRGALKHHGWVAAQVRFPAVSETLDPRVLAPAEVELA